MKKVGTKCEKAILRWLFIVLGISALVCIPSMIYYHQTCDVIEEALSGEYIERTKTAYFGTSVVNVSDKLLNDWEKGAHIYVPSFLTYALSNKVYETFAAGANNFLLLLPYDEFNEIARDENIQAFMLPTGSTGGYSIYLTSSTQGTQLYHELGHYADYSRDLPSQMSEWIAVYNAEWIEDPYLVLYKEKKAGENEEEQKETYLKESFAEAFAQWNIHENNETGDSISQYNVCDREHYPLSYEYMDRFYGGY